MCDHLLHVQGVDEHLRIGAEFLAAALRFLGLGEDIDVPAGQLGGQADVLAAPSDGKTELVVRDHHLDAVGFLVQDHLGHLGGGERVDDEGGGVGRPLDDVDLLALELPNHGLDAGAAHTDAGADRVDAGIVGDDRDLGARARVPGHRHDLDDVVVNFRHFLGKQLGHELGMGARQEDLRAAWLLAHVHDVGAHPVAGGIVLARDALVAAQERFRPAQIHDHVAKFDALDQTVDDLADAVLVLFVLAFTLGLAHLLHDHLLGRLGGDAAEVDGRQRVDQEIADLRVRLGLARRFQVRLGDLVLHLLRHLDVARQPDLAGRAVDGGADIVLVSVFRAPGLLNRLLHGFENLFALDSLVAGDGFGHLQQFGARANGLGIQVGFDHGPFRFSDAASNSSVSSSFARPMSA